jgi:predicted nucleic acid-binding protein
MQIIDGHLDLVGSDIINFEISKTPDFERRSITERLSMLSTEFVKTTNEIIERAKKIQNLGINAFDALHISCAEFSRADFFLTTDNSLIKTCNKNNKHLIIKVMNPVNWIMEEF